MRKLSLLISFLLTVSAIGMVFTYLSHRVGQQRIVVQDEWVSGDEPVAYRAYGNETAP